MHCSPRKRTRLSKSDSMQVPRMLTVFARFKARIFDGFWKTNSARFAHLVRFTTCCINWDTHHWFLVLSTETRTKTRNRILKKVPRNGPRHSPSTSGKKTENLFSGRSAFRTAGNTDPSLGTKRFPATGCAADAVRLPVDDRSGLS